jgi:2-succinyl-5-enolpyruvyl-6-hydroxy-3-cyclohexene-1-carboxylate synthase
MRRNKTEAGIAQLEQTMATAFNIMEDNQYMRLKKTAKQDETLIASMSKLVRDVTH